MKAMVVSCLAASLRVVSSCACACRVPSSSSTFDSRAAILVDVAGETDDDEEVDFADLPCKAIPKSERMDFRGASCMYLRIVSPERLVVILILFVSRPKAA